MFTFIQNEIKILVCEVKIGSVPSLEMSTRRKTKETYMLFGKNMRGMSNVFSEMINALCMRQEWQIFLIIKRTKEETNEFDSLVVVLVVVNHSSGSHVLFLHQKVWSKTTERNQRNHTPTLTKSFPSLWLSLVIEAHFACRFTFTISWQKKTLIATRK